MKYLRPNFEFLDQFGDSIVPVAHCEMKQYTDQKREQMKFRDFLNYWKNLCQNRSGIA